MTGPRKRKLKLNDDGSLAGALDLETAWADDVTSGVDQSGRDLTPEEVVWDGGARVGFNGVTRLEGPPLGSGINGGDGGC